MTFRALQDEARRQGLILEKIHHTCDDEVYRYEVTDNNTGMSGLFQTLNEAAVEILNPSPHTNAFLI